VLAALPLLAVPDARTAPNPLEDDRCPVEDPQCLPKSPERLWEQVDIFYANQMWMKMCARLDRLRELGQSLAKVKKKAGYAYARCAAIALKTGDLKVTDNALELSRQLAGDLPERKPVEAELHRTLGRTALEQGDLNKALSHFEIAAAKHTDRKQEQEVGVLLAKYARIRYSQDKVAEARDANNAALIYYPENRDAVRLRDALDVSGKGLALGIVLGILAVGLVVIFLLRRRPSASLSSRAYDD
jgi:tetratricopeptide (TPR) repeat protein